MSKPLASPKQRIRKAVRIRRKNLLLDQVKIDRARRIFRTATETDAIHRALDAVADLEAFQLELNKGFGRLIGRGGFVDHFSK